MMKDRNQYLELSVIFASNYSKIVDYCSFYVGSVEEAKDIAQDCFVNFWDRRVRYRNVPPETILFAMARNACLNYLKHKAVENRYCARILSEAKSEAESFERESSIYAELEILIRHGIEDLPDICRKVFELSFYDELTVKEISGRLGISVQAVYKSLDRAYQKLKKHLKSADFGV
ncbi:MAG: RNA polymerase sigma-70 factor [Bacteroidales bacterium]|nr:RNA polymerase sigma-70 factor [Bacteroidales bacterium]